jgi:hypothetical protein
MKVKVLLLPLSITATIWAASAQPTVKNTDSPIIIQNMYWAKPGKADDVYSWRLHASDVRVKLGLPRGRVLRRKGDSTTLPDVIWECEYPNADARSSDVATTSHSPEFKEVEAHMDTLIRQFDRIVLQEH